MNIIKQGDSFILEKNGQQIGHCQIAQHTAPNGAVEYQIQQFEIAPQWRGKGYGTYLLKGVLHRTGGYDPEKETMYRCALPWADGCAPTTSARAVATLPISIAKFFSKAEFVPKGSHLVRHKKPDLTATTLVRQQICQHLAGCNTPTPLCIDATCGNGHDSLFLAQVLPADGHLLALDIQQEAIAGTAARLAAANIPDAQYTLHCADHANLAQYAASGSADVIVFNFGWLPGADHTVFSQAHSSIPALTAALDILKPGGLLCATLYSGAGIGDGEKTAILHWLQALPIRQYTVLACNFANWASTAPLPCFVFKK